MDAAPKLPPDTRAKTLARVAPALDWCAISSDADDPRAMRIALFDAANDVELVVHATYCCRDDVIELSDDDATRDAKDPVRLFVEGNRDLAAAAYRTWKSACGEQT